MKTFDINPHSIIMTVGPSNCGKSYFCNNILIPQLQKLTPLVNRTKISINYISSDLIRQNLLNENFDKNHPAMLTASEAAFDILYQQVKSACTFPTNSEFIIIDTKGTSDIFRQKIYDIAKQYNYKVVCLIFFYSNYDDYTKYTVPNKFMSKDIKKTKDYLFSGLKKHQIIDSIIRIKSINFDDIKFTSEKHNELIPCSVNNNNDYFIVSDIHGCYDEFINLLTNNKFIIENGTIISDKQLIVAGDFIDKGPQTEQVINFIYDNINKIKVVIGNHDYRLNQELLGNLTHMNEPWYDTYDFIKDNEELKNKFLTIMRTAVPFIRNDYFIITHAPCRNIYLGKIDNKSKVKQRYIYYENIPYYEDLTNKGIFNDELCNIYHIFGHMMTSTPGNTIKNRMLIDGGCVIGNELIGVTFNKNYYKIHRVLSNQKKDTEELNNIQEYKFIQEHQIDIDNLSYEVKKRIKKYIINKVNFISGTMSPVDKFNNQLESIEAGIDFYKSAGVMNVTMQQKDMGSRMNCYLFKTNEESYAISRHGFKLNINLNHVYDKLRDRVNIKLSIDWNKVKCIILDGELMPWSVLGDGLIKDFYSIGINVKKEIQFLKDTNFEFHFNKLLDKYNQTNFKQDISTLKKQEVIDKYGPDYETFKVIKDFNTYISNEEKDKLIDTYIRQVNLFGYKAENIEYRPFAILKIIYNDGTEVIPYISGYNNLTNESMYNLLNENGCKSYNLSNDDEIKQMINDFNKYTVEQHLEGVVLKSTNLLEKKVPPYLKIRNPEYLSIVYGYDYRSPYRYNKLLERKSINNKLKISKSEWKRGLKLLSINYNNINKDNNELIQLYAHFITEIDQENNLDPRL